MVDRAWLDRWFSKRQPGAGPSTRAAQLLWGLYSLSVLLANEWLEPDEGMPHVVKVRVASHPIADPS